MLYALYILYVLMKDINICIYINRFFKEQFILRNLKYLKYNKIHVSFQFKNNIQFR